MKVIQFLIVATLIVTAHLAEAQSARSKAVTNQSRFEIKPEGVKEQNPWLYFGINAGQFGTATAFGAPMYPIDLGIRVSDSLTIGPTATFSGNYHHDDADFKLTGFGAQAMYSFGQRAIGDGFYLQAFFQHYSLSALKMANIGDAGMGMPMMMPLEGSVPLNSFGGGVGYQWVWKNGLRIAAGVKVAYIASNSDQIDVMGMSKQDLKDMGSFMGAANDAGVMSQRIDIPAIEDKSMIIPVPEISLGWAI